MKVFGVSSIFVICLLVSNSHAWDLLGSFEDAEVSEDDSYPPINNYRNIPRQNVMLVAIPQMENPAENEVIPPPPTTVEKQTLDLLVTKVDNLMSEVKSQQDQIKALETANAKMIEKVDLIEQNTKGNNLIFLNVRESKNENHRTTLNKALQVIRMLRIRLNSNDIAMALRADGEISANTSRPIIVKFVKFSDKMKVLAAKAKLRRSKVDIVGDYSELVEARRRELIPFLLEKRRQGHNAFIIYDKLVVDNVRLTLDELKEESRRELLDEVELQPTDEVPTVVQEEFETEEVPEVEPDVEDVDVETPAGSDYEDC